MIPSKLVLINKKDENDEVFTFNNGLEIVGYTSTNPISDYKVLALMSDGFFMLAQHDGILNKKEDQKMENVIAKEEVIKESSVILC